MRTYEGRGLGEIYYQVLRDLGSGGEEIVVRGQKCLEFPEPVTLVYTDPGACLMRIPNRKFNPFFAMAEVPWILSGDGNAEWIAYFNKNMLEFLDEGLEDFHGSYGMRIRKWPVYTGLEEKSETWVELDQIQHVVRKLREDPFCRQAVISLWDPVRDNLVKSKDIPCNNSVYLRLRNGVLDQMVVIRSNDLLWGTPHNAIQFTHLQALIAGRLGAKMGTLTYVCYNLHYYLDMQNQEMAEAYRRSLGHTLNAAHSSKTLLADKPNNFCVATEDEVRICKELSTKVRNGLSPFLMSGDYWLHTIPRLLWIYAQAKDHLAPMEALFNSAVLLPKPFPELIVDFWQDSKKPRVQELVNGLRNHFRLA